MAFLSSREVPFGFLQPLHAYFLSHTIPLTPSNFFWAMILPFAPLGFQAYYLQYQGTRPIRIALGILGIAVVIHAALTYRIVVPEYNAYNIGMHVAFLHIIGKYIEFASLKQPIVDPYIAKGRSRILSAVDLCINSRWIGLPPIFDEEVRDHSREARHASTSAKTRSHHAINGHSNGVKERMASGGPKTTTVDQSRWLTTPSKQRTRPQASLRHLRRFTKHFIVCDTMLLFIRQLAPVTVGTPNVPPDVWNKFLSTPFTFFPHTPLAYPAPRWLISLGAEFFVGAGIWQVLSMGYHFFALLAVGSGIWEVETWEVDIMYSPWNCDSLLDLWGRGWHQLFRHHFLLLSIVILRFLGLNPRGPLLLPLIFTWSAGLHMFAQLSMNPVIELLPIGAFFFLSGIGCALELFFRQVTGKRVRGYAGRIWMWSWLIISARAGARAWMESGMCGNFLTGRGSVGWVFVPLIRRLLLDVV